MIPRQFGPRIRMPSNFRCSSRTCCSSLRAFLADLAESGRDDHDAPRARLAAARGPRPGTVGAGVQITARSGACGRLGMSLYA